MEIDLYASLHPKMGDGIGMNKLYNNHTLLIDRIPSLSPKGGGLWRMVRVVINNTGT